MEAALRLEVTGFSIAIAAVLWFSVRGRQGAEYGEDSRLLRAMILSTIVILSLDFLSWLFDGKAGSLARVMVIWSNAFYFALHTLPVALYISYSDYQIHRDPQRLAKIALPLAILAGSAAIVSLLTPATGLLFTIDDGNRYHRSALGYPIFASVQFLLIILSMILVIRGRKKLARRVILTLLSYPVPLMAAGVAQMLVYGLVLLWPSVTIFLVASTVNIESRRSRTDYLTGTANRRSLDEELERRLAASGRPGLLLCALLIDLDDFKSINDRLGHEVGDRALEDAAALLLASVRADDFVARMGGDEFVVLAGAKDPSAVEELAARVEAAVDRHNSSAGRPYRLGFSIGRAVRTGEDSGNAADFLARLDADMYARKQKRKIGTAGSVA